MLAKLVRTTLNFCCTVIGTIDKKTGASGHPATMIVGT